ncbi:MAG: M1 family metallopeptidase [Fuerstiella sp.]|nr:M1 family metallopeptidase [Fuerstiella sp.]
MSSGLLLSLSLKVHRMFPKSLARSRTFFAALWTVLFLIPHIGVSQIVVNRKNPAPDAFRQLNEVLPTPNTYRTASGAPGHEYWQQKVDYDIDVELHDDTQRITAAEVISYLNNSPDTLRYLWLQLDANRFHPDSAARRHKTAPSLNTRVGFKQLDGWLKADRFPGGTKITSVTDASNNRKLNHQIVGSNMRVDLPQPLSSGETVSFKVRWEYNIPNATVIGGRGGFEHFEKDDNNIYEIAQWFPRLCVYSDASGWQHKEFLGKGEFALEFGDYVVRLTVPSDHVVASTGELQNPADVLSSEQQSRLRKSRSAEEPVFIVTPEEALENQKTKSKDRKTWVFKAQNVRDFAFASSRKFIWDAVGHNSGGKKVLAMSYFPNEAEPLWSKYSTHAIVHTLKVYSKYTFHYPYPVAISVNGPVYGMEYPMICFNGPRPEDDGTYSKRTKYALISVIIHEVGHNYFPMIVNTDERQWTWMDEGLNTFLQYLSEVEWEDKYPSRRGEPAKITSYMRSTNQVPIMTNSESLLQFGPNGYSKPATALNILRETILGRDLFDFAFKEYSRRWMFKRPYPADFFRSVEDAAGVDLDWFWRGWFYSTDHVDIAISNVRHYQIDNGDPVSNSRIKREERDDEPETRSQKQNKPLPKRVDRFPELKDFYNSYDDLTVTDDEKKKFQKYLKDLKPEQRRLLGLKTHFYIVDLENKGGLVMPVILKVTHSDKTTREIRLPAEVWVKSSLRTSRLIMSKKPITSMELDPHLETADVDTSNNHFPPQIHKSRFKLYKEGKTRNEMQKAGLGKKAADEKADDEKKSKTDGAKEKE